MRNPVSRNVVYRIDLGPDNVDLLLLMTKNPLPMAEHLDEMSELDINFSFQVTITPYGKDIEPGLPRKRNVIDAFRQISERIGKERMIWRYDPIILNGSIDEDYHREGFGYIANELKGYADRCTIGFLDVYEKLKPLNEKELLRKASLEEMKRIGSTLAQISGECGMALNQCSTKIDLSDVGVVNNACISKEYMASLNVPYEEFDVPLREGCGCVKNIDIGDYDTCGHDCIYCYANRPDGRRRSSKRYDPDGEMLFGTLGENDSVVRLSSRPVRRITDF